MTDQFLYRGKAKEIYQGDEPGMLRMHFTDNLTAFNAEKSAVEMHKGMLNNMINAQLMTELRQQGIANHFVARTSETDSRVQALKMIPLEFVVRNIACGSICKRLGLEQGTKLQPIVFELYYKNDALGDPLINESHVKTLDIASPEIIQRCQQQSFAINEFLIKRFQQAGLLLVDFKLEFGLKDNQVVLGDEITPDGARIWDIASNERLDKDRFRFNLGPILPAYQQIAERLGIAVPEMA